MEVDPRGMQKQTNAIGSHQFKAFADDD